MNYKHKLKLLNMYMFDNPVIIHQHQLKTILKSSVSVEHNNIGIGSYRQIYIGNL